MMKRFLFVAFLMMAEMASAASVLLASADDGDSYTITVLTGSSSRGSVSGGGTYTYGSTAVLTATANPHYHFSQWRDGNRDNPRTVIVVAEATYVADFVPDTHTVTVAVNDDRLGSVTGGGRFAYNAFDTLEAIAADGCRFMQWSDEVTDNPRRIRVKSDTTFTALFVSDSYTITVLSGSSSLGSVTGGGTYDYGSEAILTATAEPHYHFSQWRDGNRDNPRTVIVVAEATYVADFAPDTHVVTAAVNDEQMGSVTGGGRFVYNAFDTLEAFAVAGFRFVQWDDGSIENPRRIRVKCDTSFTAIFQGDPEAAIGEVITSQVTTIVRDKRIIVGGADGHRLTVTDVMGRVVFCSTVVHTTAVDVPSTGLYLLQIDGRLVRRVAVFW